MNCPTTENSCCTDLQQEFFSEISCPGAADVYGTRLTSFLVSDILSKIYILALHYQNAGTDRKQKYSKPIMHFGHEKHKQYV